MFRRIFSMLIVVVMLGGVLLTAVSSTNAAQKEEMDKLMAENLIKTLHVMVEGFENKLVNIERLTTDVLPMVLYRIADDPEFLGLWVEMEKKVLEQGELMEKIGVMELWKKEATVSHWPPWPWPWPWPWPDCIPVLWAFENTLPNIARELDSEYIKGFIEMEPEKASLIIMRSLRLTAEWIADARQTANLERLTSNAVPILITGLVESPELRERSIPMMKELGEYSEQEAVQKAVATLKESLIKDGLSEEQALISSWAAFSKGVRAGLLIAPLLAE
jgi:hypothetical protein